MSQIPSLQGKRGQPGRRVYEKKEQPQPFAEMPLKEKLQTLANWYGSVGKDQKSRRNATWYLMALYYQGFQNVELNANGTAFDVYEKDDLYVENQFRRHCDAVANMQVKAEGEIIARPSSPQPVDIAKSRVAGPVLDIMKANVGYDRVKAQKALYKVLFGNSFQFADYIVDKKYGTITSPKYEYKEIEDPEAPEGMLLSKVVTGYEERPKGQEITVVASPLEIDVPPEVRRFEDVPYLRWVQRLDVEIINYIYPDLGATGSAPTGDDSGQSYIEQLANLPGNVFGDGDTFNRGSNLVKKAELARTWLQPCTFRGDKELLNKFPDGVHVVTVDGTIVEYYAENLLDRWTHEVLIPNPVSLLGDGLYDALLMQDQINEINSLLIKHTYHSTVGHKYFDENKIDPKDVINDPVNGLVPVRNLGMDQTPQSAIFTDRPNTISQDVPAWKQSVGAAMQDMTSAYDPAVGKGLGANTPYSQSVFLSERAQSRWQGSLAYNRPELIRYHRQLLKIAQDNWVDTRQRAIEDHTGAWSFQQFSQADLQGEIELSLTNTDMMPRSRAEQIQGLQMMNEIAQLLPMLSPKQKLKVEESLGFAADSNPMNTQIARAYRHIDRIKKGEDIAPLPFVDDPAAQIPVFQEYLASEQGEEVAETDPETFKNLYLFMVTLSQMMMGQTMMAPPQAGPQDPNAPKGDTQKGVPGGQVGQQGGGPNSGSQPPAQSPAPAPPVQPPAAV